MQPPRWFTHGIQSSAAQRSAACADATWGSLPTNPARLPSALHCLTCQAHCTARPARLPMRSPAPSKAGGQWRRLLPALLLALLALPLCVSGQEDSTPAASPSGSTVPLVPFHSVVSCLPFSLLIRPSNTVAVEGGPAASNGGGAATSGGSAPAYSLRLDSTDANITGAFEYRVTSDGTLHLSLSTPIVANSCASAVVELPADALREVCARCLLV